MRLRAMSGTDNIPETLASWHGLLPIWQVRQLRTLAMWTNRTESSQLQAMLRRYFAALDAPEPQQIAVDLHDAAVMVVGGPVTGRAKRLGAPQ